MPVFNGGEHLCQSLASCAHAGLSGSEYEMLVVDNCSTDGAADMLPGRDDQGAIIQLHRNPCNIGRVGNWNRCVELAIEQGFQYVTFLFAGDRWMQNGSLRESLSLIRENNAAVAFSPFTIADENGNGKRGSQRFYVSGRTSFITSPRDFLSTLLASGLFPLGPIQANIYRISRGHRLYFDEKAPTVTDVRATLDFIIGSASPIAIVSKPFMEWRENSKRFHASMGAAQIIRDYFETFQTACERTGVSVDYARAKTRVIINAVRLITSDAPPMRWPALLMDLRRHSRLSPHKSGLFYLLEALWLRFALGRHLIEFA